jgi:hypothetical protein
MSTKQMFLGVAVAALLGTAGIDADAAVFEVNVAGWQAHGFYTDEKNSFALINIGAGSLVTGFQFTGLNFRTAESSWLNEVVLSVEDAGGTASMDLVPSNLDRPGMFGPASGAWGTNPNSSGATFTTASGFIRVSTWDLYDDLSASPDALFTSGTLQITVVPIPEPATYALMAFGLAATALARRRQRRGN